jgi:hypothetical protein
MCNILKFCCAYNSNSKSELEPKSRLGFENGNGKKETKEKAKGYKI